MPKVWNSLPLTSHATGAYSIVHAYPQLGSGHLGGLGGFLAMTCPTPTVTTKTNRTRKVADGTVKKSMETRSAK